MAQWSLPPAAAGAAASMCRRLAAPPGAASSPPGGVPGDGLWVQFSHWLLCVALHWPVVFPTEEQYLEHQSTQQHDKKCRAIYTAYTGGCQRSTSLAGEWREGGRVSPPQSDTCEQHSTNLRHGFRVCRQIARRGERGAHCACARQPASCAAVGGGEECGGERRQPLSPWHAAWVARRGRCCCLHCCDTRPLLPVHLAAVHPLTAPLASLAPPTCPAWCSSAAWCAARSCTWNNSCTTSFGAPWSHAASLCPCCHCQLRVLHAVPWGGRPCRCHFPLLALLTAGCSPANMSVCVCSKSHCNRARDQLRAVRAVMSGGSASQRQSPQAKRQKT
jgi:hypothetical protein